MTDRTCLTSVATFPYFKIRIAFRSLPENYSLGNPVFRPAKWGNHFRRGRTAAHNAFLVEDPRRLGTAAGGTHNVLTLPDIVILNVVQGNRKQSNTLRGLDPSVFKTDMDSGCRAVYPVFV